MRIDIMTLFPDMIDAVMRESIIGRAQDKGLVTVKATNIRDYALDKHHKADDAPYGGGRGMVMLPEPLYLCHQALTGGEIPAMAVADAVCRMVPGVLPDEEAFTAESHWEGLLEHPQYTRPENWRGREVPAVLLSGHHANIEAWRREMSLRRTKADRPDLFARFQPKDKQDKKILGRILQDGDGTV